MPDMNMLEPALIVFFSFLIVGLIITKISGHKTKQRWYAEYNKLEEKPEHAWVDNSPSLGANLAYWLLGGIGTYIATAMLFFHSNPLWLLELFTH